ncbi:MAG: amino acid ABC transporter ATP-binding protein [Alkalibacterium gilvum]|uniref:amino acid ABC transporter ATP-binding protein n=1 Tax=Alkalibacterium gilvum TaxID=1130080 RepID=UPI00264C4DB9|nr:ATP-binding cassette domain-containing protein [Alkalibacterium sp.]MDN6398122.1 ATP-binding cassette domain-containing protein [Alkalibacterium sp.]
MLVIEGLSKKMNGLDLIKDFSLTVQKKEIVSIVGESGSGKTTFIRLLNQLDKPDKGQIKLDNDRLFPGQDGHKSVNKKIGMVFQDFQLFPNLTVKENCTLSPLLNKSIRREEINLKADELLGKLDILDKQHSYPKELSGGQKQRVAIARALMLDPQIICLDEPTSALDYETADRFGELLKSVIKNDVGIVMITHDLRFAEKFSDRIISSELFLKPTSTL